MTGGRDAGERPAGLDADPRRTEFERLYLAYYQQITGYVRRRMAPHEADDVVSQVFAVAWRRFEHVPAPPDDRLWLFGVARNSVTDHHRSERRRLRLHARLFQDVATAAPEPADAGPGYEPIRVAISRLRPKDREALQLVLWEELSHQQAAAVVGCSVNAFEVRYRRARNAVRDAVIATHPALRSGRERVTPRNTTSRMNPS